MFKKIWDIMIDIAGGILIVASALTGWLPGPGGIPLFLAGLGLLSINHDWAKNLLEKMKKEGDKIMEKVFPDQRLVKFVYDLIALIFLTSSAYIFVNFGEGVLIPVGVSLAISGVGLLLINGQRLKKFKAKLRRG